jgi:hypothetical protein
VVGHGRAVELIHAAGTGAVLSLLSMAPEDRDLDLADAMYDAVMQSILTDVPALAEDSTTAAAVAFRTVVPKLPMLTRRGARAFVRVAGPSHRQLNQPPY